MKKWIQLFILAVLHSACANGQSPASDNPNEITIRRHGKVYSLSVVGDKVPSFMVNGHPIPKEAFNDYEPLFSELQNQLEEKKKSLTQKALVFTDQNRTNLVADLVRDKIIGSFSDITSFRLDGNGFMVNGQKQSFAVFTRYKTRYLSGYIYFIQFN